MPLGGVLPLMGRIIISLYCVLAELGTGGMGKDCRARDSRLGCEAPASLTAWRASNAEGLKARDTLLTRTTNFALGGPFWVGTEG